MEKGLDRRWGGSGMDDWCYFQVPLPAPALKCGNTVEVDSYR